MTRTTPFATATGRARLLRLLALVVLVAGGVVGGASAPAPVRAATPDLTMVTDATYDVLPDERRVAVSVDITATNHLRDTVTRRFYFDTGYLAVLPGTTHFKVTASGATPKVSVAAKKKDYTLLKISFGTRLSSGRSLALKLTFDVPDPGGAPERPVRISPSLVSFFAWAYATDSTSGSSVTLRVPAGYTTTVGRGPLTGPTIDSTGAQVWTSGKLATPLTFIADINADKPGGYATSTRTIRLDDRTATIALQAWPDDPEWAARVGDLFGDGLPKLATAIGLPWPLDKPLDVQEAVVRTTGGYAGLFDPSTSRVQVAYAADALVVLHEASHAWFNGALVADRWTAEAFASYYAEEAARALGIKAASPALTDELRASAYPLNAWGPVGEGEAKSDAYGYAASLELARAIAARAGDDGLRAVWEAAAGRIGAYQPLGGPVEKVADPPDWRGLLDLLEESGTAYEDLWRTWVVRPDDLALLTDRAVARSTYTALVTRAGAWRLPASIRAAMRTWQFATAEGAMRDADAVLDQRAALETEAAAAGVTLPDGLRLAFEGSDGIPAAAAEASAEQATLDALVAAAGARPPDLGPLEALGLIGVDPEHDLGAARADFSKGDLSSAASLAGRAETAWRTASGVGRGRLISIGLLLVAAALATFLVLQRRRSRRLAAG
jgi:hypothetical protein